MYSELVREIINIFDLSIPVDFDKIFGKLTDVSILYGQDLNGEEGLIEKSDGKYIIKLHSEQEDLTQRDRFTIAHELGHLFLKHIDDYETLYRKGANELEYQANSFAAELLMPEEHFKRTVRDNTDDDGFCNVVQVAEKFNVSASAVVTRGKFLGVFSWEA